MNRDRMVTGLDDEEEGGYTYVMTLAFMRLASSRVMANEQ